MSTDRPLAVMLGLGAGWYEADDHEGARGVYHVLARTDGQRVTLS
jgi:hypothetical protein